MLDLKKKSDIAEIDDESDEIDDESDEIGDIEEIDGGSYKKR